MLETSVLSVGVTEKEFCQSSTHIPNIPHPQHPNSPISHIRNIPHSQHTTSLTSQFPNISHPQYPTSQTSHIMNIPHPSHPISRTSHIPNGKIIVSLLFLFDYSSVTQVSWSVSSNFPILQQWETFEIIETCFYCLNFCLIFL